MPLGLTLDTGQQDYGMETNITESIFQWSLFISLFQWSIYISVSVESIYQYDESIFHYRVERVPMPDHNVPSLR